MTGTQWIVDPTNPTVAFIGSTTDPDFGMAIGDMTMFVHHPDRCAGRPCTVHNPSDHHMRQWMLHFRADRNLCERICAHGIGHPDPDEKYAPMFDGGAHGCDGCCRMVE